ncbi:MAG: hypothetical protein NZ735_07170, partial [Candidatus Marinimicrobia bacterium]|nr:hypothetical protein [Candidatus Neomarinimicrobiota bacterium]
MGACDFSLIQIGKYKTVREAYKDAVQDALYEDGHDPYNGTISTTDTLSHPYYGEVPRFNTKAFKGWEEKNLDRL